MSLGSEDLDFDLVVIEYWGGGCELGDDEESEELAIVASASTCLRRVMTIFPASWI